MSEQLIIYSRNYIKTDVDKDTTSETEVKEYDIIVGVKFILLCVKYSTDNLCSKYFTQDILVLYHRYQ